MRRQLLTGLLMTVVLIVVLGVLYPLAVYGLGQVLFKDNADGSFVTNKDGQVVGSALLGQSFLDAGGNAIPKYFQPRPSAAGYDAQASGPSNLGPSNPKLLDAVAPRVSDYRALNGLDPATPVPVDAVTASASGLDPHISVANAKLQASRVATARNLPLATVDALVAKHTQGRQWGVLGEKVVNVLELNLDLDGQG
jgi:K+-transporting ATPase ATPase C chain